MIRMMPGSGPILIAGLVAVACAVPCEMARARVPELPGPDYSPDAPPGPDFPEAEKARQRAAGRRILAGLHAAWAAGEDSYTIPPGDYRFNGNSSAEEGRFLIKGLDRDGKKPFRILGYGATIWAERTPPGEKGPTKLVVLSRCANISLEGITVDAYPRGCMETRVVDFDIPGNRILVEPLAGTQLVTGPKKAENQNQMRCVPYKSNGHHIAAYYQIDKAWGPGNFIPLGYEITPNGRYWVTMGPDKLLRTLNDPVWMETYGKAGILEKGDLIAWILGTSTGIGLEDCKQITVKDCTVHAAKAMLAESGYGDNRWINCHFMARPGTNHLFGGDGTMMDGCMVGSTLDGCIIHRTTDDAFNNHGYWKHTHRILDDGVFFRRPFPGLLEPGHKADFYDLGTNKFIRQLTVAAVDGQNLRFEEPVGEELANTVVMFPDFQNAGWVIRNCLFVDCYQRILLQCGPGLFENNRIERVGSSLVVRSGPLTYWEGGIPNRVTIRGNVFIDSAVSPLNSMIEAAGVGRPLESLVVEGNVFYRSGREAVRVSWAEGVVMRNNLVVHPFEGNRLLPETRFPELPAFRFERVKGALVEGQTVVRNRAGHAVTCQPGSTEIVERGNQTVVDSDRSIEASLRALAADRKRHAGEIIEMARKELNANGGRSF